MSLSGFNGCGLAPNYFYTTTMSKDIPKNIFRLKSAENRDIQPGREKQYFCIPILGGIEIFLVISCYRNRDKNCLLCAYADLTSPKILESNLRSQSYKKTSVRVYSNSLACFLKPSDNLIFFFFSGDENLQ